MINVMLKVVVDAIMIPNMSSNAFTGQHNGEQILFVFRRHFVTLGKGFRVIIFATLIGWLVSLGLSFWGHNVNYLWGLLFGFCVGGLYFLVQWIKWYFSVFILTNERLRQVTQRGLFSRSVIDLDLDNVKNISYNVPGFMAEICGFGTIALQTMVGDMVIHRVARVDRIYNELSDAIRAAKGSDNRDEIIDNESEQ